MKITTKLVHSFNHIIRVIPLVRIMDKSQSLDYLINSDVALARYGDGELNTIMGGDIHFQKYDSNLRSRLIEILRSNYPGLAIGLPPYIRSYKGVKSIVRYFWRMNMSTGRMHWYRYCRWNKTYIDGQFTWCLTDAEKPEANISIMEKIPLLWENKDLLIVEGITGRLGVGTDMLSNSKSIKRILCPSRDAFSCYEDIFNAIKANYQKGQRIILCLGPTATVLAYDLFKEGITSLDLGHINKEYDLYCKISGHQMDPQKVLIESSYQSQIIGRIENEA